MDKQRSKDFLATMTGIMNGGALALMCSIGHRTGLFDTMSTMAPAAPAEIAEEAGLQERYVREWLSAMVAGGIVDHDEHEGTFHLPPEHAGLVTRAAGPLNMTTFCQYVGLLGKVEDEVVEAFRNGGGVPYDRYPDFHRVMAESSGQRFDRALLDQVVPLLPGGSEALDVGIDLADVGCGSGRALLILAERYPNSRFTGYDIAEGAIGNARAAADERRLDNVTFEIRDAAQLEIADQFDIVTSFDAVHDQAYPKSMLAGIFAGLRSGGTYLCVEPKASSHLHENLEMPGAPLLYTVSTMHCMTVSLAYDGEGLGAAWGAETATEYLTAAGFADIEITGIRDDRSNTYFLSTKP
ncbi:MAG: class I SAM-dependent methyltransferase [Actinomycetota bacterium]